MVLRMYYDKVIALSCIFICLHYNFMDNRPRKSDLVAHFFLLWF